MAKILKNYSRHDIIKLLPKPNQNIGVELGVAEGTFSERMVKSGRFKMVFGVDRYSDKHTTSEYKRALKRVGLHSNYKLLRLSFDEALDLFDDESLDFVYVDGYAHTGEEGGETVYQWAKKVKIGGVLAGDDYHSDWPLVVRTVDQFICDTNFELILTEKVEELAYCRFPTWAVVKTTRVDVVAPPDMVRNGKLMGEIKLKRRTKKKRVLREFLKTRLSDGNIARVRRTKQIFKSLLQSGSQG